MRKTSLSIVTTRNTLRPPFSNIHANINPLHTVLDYQSGLILQPHGPNKWTSFLMYEPIHGLPNGTDPD